VDVSGLPPGWDAVAQQPWTVVTVMFTSGHLIHVAGAAGCIFFLGGALERRVGSAHLLGIYLLAGITGSIAIATATSAGAGNPEVSVGASAAFLGLLGALAGRPPTALTERLQLPKIVAVVLLVSLVQPMVGIGYWTSPLAHAGGIAVGALYGHALRTRGPSTAAVHARAAAQG
jgi:membrane associated rhomboid family serine protease